MTQAQLYTALVALGLPVAYNVFKQLPTPPFIAYRFTDNDDFMADNQNYKSVDNYDIELYSVEKDPTSEALIETMLKTNKKPYTKTETWIESESLYEVVYSIQLI